MGCATSSGAGRSSTSPECARRTGGGSYPHGLTYANTRQQILKAIGPRVRRVAATRGSRKVRGSRLFIRNELVLEVERRYHTMHERSIIGESLAELFVVKRFLVEPKVFDHYVAFDSHSYLEHVATTFVLDDKRGRA